MSSVDDSSPVSHQTVRSFSAGHDDSAGAIDASSVIQIDTSSQSVAKRPFLRRGARMPISKIPVDPFTPVVQAIKNPPKPASDPDSIDRSFAQPTAAPVRKSLPMAPMVFDLDPVDKDTSFGGISRGKTPPSRPLNTKPPAASPYESTQFSSRPLRRQKAPPPPDSRSARVSADSLIYGNAPPPARSPRVPAVSHSVSEEGLLERVRELDSQIEKFKKENEQCKRLRLERETALAEANRYKERAIRELEAAEKEIEEQKGLIATEKRRLQQDKDRGRSIAAQLRELTEENRNLREKLESMDSESSGKVKKLKNEVARLNSLLGDVSRQKYDLEIEVKALTAQITGRVVPESNNSSFRTTHTRSTTPVRQPAEIVREDVAGELISEQTHADGRIDRTFPDGKREAVFPSGLRKTVWPDGSALVHFPNGDVKETSKTGVVVYRYYSTGCVQTTHPDGTEILEFTSGQIEKHFPDGAKEITFPNKLVKRIPPGVGN
jgi:centromere protein J